MDAPSGPTWPPPLPTLDADASTVLREFMTIARIHRQFLHRAFARRHLHPSQAMCVWVLSHHGRLTQSELAEVLALSRPSVTRLLQRMERGGLVARRADTVDQRQVIVELTPSGCEIQHLLHEAASEYTSSALARLPADDRAALARILGDWRRLAEQEAGP